MDVRGTGGTSANSDLGYAERHANHSANLGPNQPSNPVFSISRGPSAVPKHVQRPLASEFGSGTTLTDMESNKPPKSGAGSLYSYESTRDIAGFLKQLHGRTFNTMNDAYLLPSDETEWGRLDKQHSALMIGMGGLFPCPIELVREVLNFGDGGTTKRILDVGCGTGTWAVEVAQMFPNVQVLGIDLAPVPQDVGSFPPNLAFELDDINHGISGHYGNHFDIIHMRCVMSGIRDMDATLKDLELCLKPGGLLIVIDGDYPHEETRERYLKVAKLDGDGDVSGASEEGSWFRRIMFEAVEGSRLAGTGQNVAPWIIDTGPWDHELCDPDSTVVGSLYLPIGPWPKGANPQETQMLQFAGILMRQAFLKLVQAWGSALLRYGIPKETADHWTESAEREIVKTNPKMWFRFRFFWTRRKPVERVESTPGATPVVSVEATAEAGPIVRYPAFETYHTKEEAIAKMVKRRNSLGMLPKSAVARAWSAANPGGDHSRSQSMTSSQE